MTRLPPFDPGTAGTKIFTLYEFLYDDEGRFERRVHEASAKYALKPGESVLWFRRSGQCSRACVVEKNLDRPRSGRYYSLDDDPAAAKAALKQQLLDRRAWTALQLERIDERIATIWKEDPD